MFLAWSAMRSRLLQATIQLQAAGDGVGIFHHVLGEDFVDLLVEGVHFLVARDDGARGGGIAVHKGVERGLDHVQRHAGHARQVEIEFDRRLLRQVAGALGDFRGLVADALEVLGNLHGHGDEAQVGGQRRLGQQLDGQVVNLHLELVNDPVVCP